MNFFGVLLIILGVALCCFEIAGIIKDFKKRKDIKKQNKDIGGDSNNDR